MESKGGGGGVIETGQQRGWRAGTDGGGGGYEDGTAARMEIWRALRGVGGGGGRLDGNEDGDYGERSGRGGVMVKSNETAARIERKVGRGVVVVWRQYISEGGDQGHGGGGGGVWRRTAARMESGGGGGG